jgi:hypothetical protein
MTDPVSTLLRRSLAHMAVEVPASYRHLQCTLGGLVIELDVDGELFAMWGGPWLEVVAGSAAAPGVRITLGRSAILDVLDARVSLAEAVESNRIQVQGSLDDVLRAHDSLIAYLHAAVRAPSVPALSVELRAGSERVA